MEEKNLYFYLPDHLGGSSYITDRMGKISQHTKYITFGEVLFDEHTTVVNIPYLFNGKELQPETGLYDYGTRFYLPDIGRWLNIDPMAERREWLSHYNFAKNNPINYIDPNSALDAPIYDTYGNFLGTDDEGAIIMNATDFTQGISHSDALSKNKGYEGLYSQEAKDKFYTHYKNLPNRPDYDGYLTLEEANNWFKNGNGKSLYTDLSKIDLSGIFSLGEKYVGQVESFNLLLNSNSINDGLVYGSITLKRYPNHSVRAFSDKYDFEMHNPWNPLNWGRNIETVIGRKVAGKGTPFEINIYGSKKLIPILPWIK